MTANPNQSEETALSAGVSPPTPPAHGAESVATDRGTDVAVGIEGQDIWYSGAVHELLDPVRLDEYVQAYLQEQQPEGPTEHSIVRELAHHAAAMDLWNEAIGAIERRGARMLPEFAALAGENGSVLRDTVLAGTMSQEAVDRCEKHFRSHSRAFYRALEKMEELQTRRKKCALGELIIPPNPFATEAACENYLIGRFKTCKCPRCGGQDGCHIVGRRCWECAGCGCQTGVRHGTVMADSPIPLNKWFTAIWLLLWRPAISNAELASTLGIARLMTVRSMAARIRAAMAAANAGDLLAGLDAYCAACRATLPESSARDKQNLPCRI